MQPEEFDRLRANLMSNGYDAKNPIWLFDGEILDGWNRYRACLALNINPVFKTFEGSELDAMQFTIRTNDRRDLSSSQRAAIAVEAEELVELLKAEAARRYAENVGRPTKEKESPQLIAAILPREQREVRTQLAQTFGTNRQYVSDAAKIKAENPEAFKAIKAGEKTITEFKKEVKKENFERRKIEFKTQESPGCSAFAILGNSAEVLKTRTFPKFSAMITDPPYGMDFKSGHVDPQKWERIANDEEQDTAQVLDAVFAASLAHLADDAHVYVFGNPYKIELIKPVFERYFVLKNILIWDREVIGMGDLKTYGRSYDVVFFGYVKEWKELNGVRERDILRFNRVAPNSLKHPTEKPLDLLEYLIKKSSNPGDYILDPFAGSFTTCEAARNCGRNSYGIELNPKYIPTWTN